MKRFFCLATILLLFAGCNTMNKTATGTPEKTESNQAVTGTPENAAKDSSKPVSSPASEPTKTSKMKNPVNQAVLQLTAAQLNRSTPMKVDEDTLLTKVDVQEDGLLYNYELVNHGSTEFETDSATKIFRSMVKDRICKDSDTKASLKQGYSFYYSYVGKDKKPVTKFSIAPADCGF